MPKPVLVELHSVSIYIKRADGEKGGEVYGRIMAEDGAGVIDFFNQKKNESASVDSDGFLSLTGPCRCITGPNFDLCLSLKEKHQDLEVSRGFLTFPFDIDTRFFGNQTCFLVHGKDGCAMLHVTMFDYAVEAKIEVNLLTNTSSAIYGTLFATYSHFKYDGWYANKYYRTALFDLPQDKAVEVQSGDKNITLSRYMVAVPLNSSLNIEAHLWDKSRSSGVEVANGSVTFTAQRPGTSSLSQSVAGPDGCIEITVSWVDNFWTARRDRYNRT